MRTAIRTTVSDPEAATASLGRHHGSRIPQASTLSSTSHEETAMNSTPSALEPLPPRDASTLVRSVRDRLRLAIILDEIPAGVRLNQVQIATQLGVSRMPIRAAIAELLAEGLLEGIPAGGFIVKT